jgi:hypothetical protein
LHPKTYQSDDVLYGIEEALSEIWKNQHPTDCSKAKFLISNNWNGGFGSEIHVAGAALGLAMNLNRVFLQNPFTLDNLEWQVNNPFCKNQSPQKHNLECYYEPWSSCTIHDALDSKSYEIFENNFKVKKRTETNLNSLNLTNLDLKELFSTSNANNKTNEIIAKYESSKYLFTHGMGGYSGFIPIKLFEVLNCSPMNKKFYYYWWRAVSIVYILRPNNYTLEWLKENDKLYLKNYNDDNNNNDNKQINIVNNDNSNHFNQNQKNKQKTN